MTTVDFKSYCISCLADMGIRGLALQWLKSFLQGLGLRVAIGESTSQHQTLSCEAPQGAILSLMLFNIYVHPLAQLIWSFRLGCHPYADDTQLFLLMDGHLLTPPDCLARCLEAMVDWLKWSWLKLNLAKTEVLWLGRHTKRLA